MKNSSVHYESQRELAIVIIISPTWKKILEIRLVLPQSTSFNAITVQVILKSMRDLQSYRSLNIQNFARVKFKQQSFSVLQEKLNLANVRNNLIYRPVMCIAFWVTKNQGIKSFLHTRPLNFWLCSPIFDVCSRKAVQGAGRNTASTIFSFFLK